MITLKNTNEIETMRVSNRIVKEVHEALRKIIEPGITTHDLDREAESLVESRGAKCAFKGYRGYPASVCVSVNEEVVHGIPSKKRKLVEGDIVGIDMGVIVDGYFGDAAVTIPVGKISSEAERLMKVTEESLYKGIKAAVPGGRVHDIGAAVQGHVESNGFSIVRDFVGHGIGRALHEEPQIPNFGRRGTGARLEPGMVLAIEPMVNSGGPEVELLGDGWTAVTCDRSLSAHFEHSVAITEEGPEILSRLD